MTDKGNQLGEFLKRQRVMIPLALGKLATRSGVSASHLGRIERGERFPSAHVLRKIAKPLGFGEAELFSLAGYLPPPSNLEESPAYIGGRLDPFVASVLSQEPVEMQRVVVAILSILKSIAKGRLE